MFCVHSCGSTWILLQQLILAADPAAAPGGSEGTGAAAAAADADAVGIQLNLFSLLSCFFNST